MITAAIIAILTVMLLALIRALAGPTLYDRILAVNLFGTKTVLFIALLGLLSGREFFLDIAMIYALLNYVSTIGVLRFFEYQGANNSPKDNE